MKTFKYTNPSLKFEGITNEDKPEFDNFLFAFYLANKILEKRTESYFN